MPLLTEESSVQALLHQSLEDAADVEAMSKMIIDQITEVSCKSAIRVAERAIFAASNQDLSSQEELKAAQLSALKDILQDLVGDEALTSRICSL